MGSGGGPYEVRRSRRARRLRITVGASGVEVVAPVRTPDREIRAFVELNRNWIADKAAAVRRVLAAHPGPIRLHDGVRVPYLGRLVPLRVSAGRRSRPEVAYREGFIVGLPAPSGGAGDEALIEAALSDWLRRQARLEVETLVERHGPKHGLVPRAIRIKDQKRLWGSCTAKGTINLNWRLIFAPAPVLEYVVVHELCHLRERNHQAAFWRLVAEVLPGYGPHRRWLRERGHLLSLRRPHVPALG